MLRLGTLGGLAIQEALGKHPVAPMHPILTQVAHQCQSHPVTPWLHPRRQVISWGKIISRKLKEDQGDSTATG